MMKKVLIVFDSFEYKAQEKMLADEVSAYCEPLFVYTKYENWLTEIFQRTQYIGGVLTHLTYWLLSFYYSLSLVKYAGINTMVFINPIVGIFYSALARIFHINQSLVIAGFLFESKSNKLYYVMRKMFVNFCYKKVKLIIVYGKNERQLYSSLFDRLKDKFCFVEYGRDFNYKNKKPFNHAKNYIAAGGRSNRNYKLLCKAYDYFSHKDEYDCLVATRPECVTVEMNESSVRFIYGITLNQFGSFIEGAKVFILPLKNTNLSAGHMSMMEAMSLRIPVIVTDIPSVRDYVDDECVFFYTADDSEKLCETIEYVLNNLDNPEVQMKVNKAYSRYESDFSFKSLLLRIVKLSVR